MRFVPPPHFAYFKVLNGIASKLLVLKQRKAYGWGGACSQRILLSQLRLSGCGPLGDFERREGKASWARRDGTTPTVQEGRGWHKDMASGWMLLSPRDWSLDSLPGHATVLPDTPVLASPAMWAPRPSVPLARPFGWELAAMGCSGASPPACGVPSSCWCVCRREAAAGSPLFSLSTSVFIKPEGNEKGFTFVAARTWQLFNVN